MGEIGIDRIESLYDLFFSDILIIQRGYDRRNRHLWSMTRWQTYYMMLASCGTDGLNKAGIRRPTDLLTFPWEKEQKFTPLSDADRQQLQDEIAAFNAANDQKNE